MDRTPNDHGDGTAPGPTAEGAVSRREAVRSRCSNIRELVSAVTDDEATAAERRAVDDHLATCTDCRLHAERVAALTRRVRLRPVEPVPELTTRVLDRARPARLGRNDWLQPALAAVGLAIAVQGLWPLVSGDASGASTHVARHLGAFAVAMGVGLLYAAWKPHRAFGMLPFAGALVAAMVVAVGLDVATGVSSLPAEAFHLLEVLGLVLLWTVSGSPGLERVRRWTPFHRRPAVLDG